MIDGFGRRVEYLRVSVTDKCNLRCIYCMPEEGLSWLRKEQLLSYEEIVEVIATMAPLGLSRVRITGGEPLVRRDLPELVRMIAAVPGIEDLSLSTNAVLLEEHSEALRGAGIKRVNISLDSLRPDRIDALSRRPGSAGRIMAGIDAAERVGFDPIKVNVVLMRGRNDDEIADFASLTRERPWARTLHRAHAHRSEPRAVEEPFHLLCRSSRQPAWAWGVGAGPRSLGERTRHLLPAFLGHPALWGLSLR